MSFQDIIWNNEGRKKTQQKMIFLDKSFEKETMRKSLIAGQTHSFLLRIHHDFSVRSRQIGNYRNIIEEIVQP